MPESPRRLEAISMLRFLPTDPASWGQEVGREELRAAGLGDWSAAGGARDDLRAAGGLADYDEPILAGDDPPARGERVVELRFKAG